MVKLQNDSSVQNIEERYCTELGITILIKMQKSGSDEITILWRMSVYSVDFWRSVCLLPLICEGVAVYSRWFVEELLSTPVDLWRSVFLLPLICEGMSVYSRWFVKECLSTPVDLWRSVCLLLLICEGVAVYSRWKRALRFYCALFIFLKFLYRVEEVLNGSHY